MIDLDSMKNMSDEDKAAALRRGYGCNCCQAVALVLTEDPNVMEVAAGFGGGMGGMNGPCGALVGAVIAAGYKTKGKGTTFYARRLYDDFKERCGAVTCRELKGVDKGKVKCTCDACVRNGVRAYLEIVGKK